MVWVKSEYADELAVLATWLSMVLPWSVAYHTGGPLGSVLAFVRLPVFELQLRFPSEITFNGVPLDVARALDVQYSGWQLAGNVYGTIPPAAALAYDGTLALANAVWSIAAALVTVAFALSLAMYVREERTRARLPVAYPRLAGWLLLSAAAFLGVATALLFLERDVVGVPIPVGLVVVAALAVALVRAETVDAVAPETTPQANDRK
jgi:hypothetical protein